MDTNEIEVGDFVRITEHAWRSQAGKTGEVTRKDMSVYENSKCSQHKTGIVMVRVLQNNRQAPVYACGLKPLGE